MSLAFASLGYGHVADLRCMMPCMTHHRRAARPLFAVALLSGAALIGGCGGGDPLPAEVVDVSRSDSGRIEVSVRITNDTDSGTTPECTVRAFDADGMRKGQDLVDGDLLLAGDSSVFTGVVGINAEDVATVEAECSAG